MATKSAQKPYHHPNLADALIETALRLLSERGAADFTIRELAKLNGVSHTAAYRHFTNKAAFMDALVAHGFHRLATLQESCLDRATPEPVSRLEALALAYMQFARENKSLYALIFSYQPADSAPKDLMQAASARAFQNLVGVVRDAQTVGYLIAGDANRMATYLTLAPHGLAALQNVDHAPSGRRQDIHDADMALLQLAVFSVLTTPPDAAERARLLNL